MNDKNIGDCWLHILRKVPCNVRVGFFSALVLGIITHMYMLTNKFPNPDDTRHMFGLGATISGGRFGLAFLEHKWFGLDVSIFATYSMPWLNGLMAIIFIGISAALIVQILKIHRPILCVLTAFIMVAYPTVAGTFHYMFTAPAYFLSLLCGVLAVNIVYCGKIHNKILSFLLCELCLVITLSIYQAYFWFAIGLFILVLIADCIDGKNDNKPYSLIIQGLLYIIILFVALVLYALVNKIILFVSGVQMVSYGGLNDMFSSLNLDWWYYIKLSYLKFFENAYKPLEEGAPFRFVLFAVMSAVWLIQLALYIYIYI